MEEKVKEINQILNDNIVSRNLEGNIVFKNIKKFYELAQKLRIVLDDFDKNEWTIYGEPNTTVTINRPNTVLLTCADIVNRIPDVINAEAGFISTSRLNETTYKLKY